jgi:hypothetical protein
MLTEDLTASLRARAGDIQAAPSSMLADLERRVATNRRRRRAAASGAVVLLIAAVSVGVAVATGGPGTSVQPAPSIDAATTVPCATPARTVPGYLDWPCPSRTLTRYDEQVIHHLRTFTALLPFPSSDSRATPSDLAIRVLAMGPLPNSRPGSTVIHAEVWLRDGTGPATLVTSYGFHVAAAPRWTRAHAVDGWSPAGDGSDPRPPGDPVLFLDSPPSLDIPRPPDECQRMADTKPDPRHGGYFAACTDTAVTRADVASIRTVGPHGQHGPLTAVTDGLAGLDTTRVQRPNWTIQALDADGNVIGSVPFQIGTP